MNKHVGYGLLYIILLPVAFILGMGILLVLIPAIANPVLLFPLFILAGFVVYTIATLIFYIKAVINHRACKLSLRDLIRVNAFIIILPSLLFILQGLSIASNPNSITEAVNQVKTLQPSTLPLSDATLINIVKGIYYFLVAYATVVVIHIIYTFRLLKQHKPLFI